MTNSRPTKPSEWSTTTPASGQKRTSMPCRPIVQSVRNGIEIWRGVRMACKPGSVPALPEGRTGDGHSSGATVARSLVRSTRMTDRRWPRAGALSSLSDLAPGGACRATPVTVGAVGSYPTLSPLPGKPRRSSLCGAFPKVPGQSRLCPVPRRALPGTVPPWSPDFPHPRQDKPGGGAAIRPSAGFEVRGAGEPVKSRGRKASVPPGVRDE